MTALIVLAAVLLAGPISILFGESRWDDRDRRPWWPGAPRR
jgi:hypothetical protein